MNDIHVYSGNIEATDHVFEPLCPVVAGTSTAYPNVAQYDMEEVQRAAYERGIQEGRQLAEKELIATVNSMVQAVDNWKTEQDNLRETMKHDLLRLCMAVARQVVMCELKTNPEAISEIVRNMLDEADGRRVFAIHLHPEDAARLKKSPVAHLLEQSEINVRVSEETEPGGCMIETAFGTLDARLETRISELAASLLGEKPVASNTKKGSAAS